MRTLLLALGSALALGLAIGCVSDVERESEASESSDLITEDDDDEKEENEGRAPTQEELRPSVEAAFPRESYRPGDHAQLVFFNAAPNVTVQLFHAGPETVATVGRSEFQGVALMQPERVGSTTKGKAIELTIGKTWASGLYFAKLVATDGRVGFAPFVLRPTTLGGHRIAVVQPTMTWQAYNLRDDDGDGKGDSWYFDWHHKEAHLGRPFLNRGVPYQFRSYDLPFLHWLAKNQHEVDMLADADVEAATGKALHDAYDLIVFPGHHEYVTTPEYDAVQAYRDLGGNLMYLSANNFFWRIIKDGLVMHKTEQWRDLGRSEAALIGTQYRGNDRGTHRGPWTVRHEEKVPWLFAGTSLKNGSTFGNAGIEIDKTFPASPDDVTIVADIANLFGPGFTAQMTYYQTPQGAKVFAAGAFTLAGSAESPEIAPLLANLWEHMTRP